jgi:hypothetical protein
VAPGERGCGRAAPASGASQRLTRGARQGRSVLWVLQSAAARGVLTPGARYSLLLRAATDAPPARGAVAIDFSPPRPPSGGTCRISPGAGAALLTEFRFECAEWAADALPLTYAFGMHAAGAGGAPAAFFSEHHAAWSGPTHFQRRPRLHAPRARRACTRD